MNKSTTTSSSVKVVAVVGYLSVLWITYSPIIQSPATFMFFKAGQDQLQDL